MYNVLIVSPDSQKIQDKLDKHSNSMMNYRVSSDYLGAIELLSHSEYAAVIIFLKVNSTEGLDLVRRVKHQVPQCVRMLIGAQSDDFILIKALRENMAHHYMITPFKVALTEQKLFAMIETFHTLNNPAVETLLAKKGGLPTIKSSYMKVIQLIDQGEEIPLVVNEIQRDHALTSTILKIANSAYYNLKTLSIFKAITYLGLSNVRNLIQATAIVESFVMRQKDREMIQSIWNHSFETMQFLAVINRRVLKMRDFDIIATAGLLHQVGIPLFLSLFKDDYTQILTDMTKQKNTKISENELDAFGFSHELIGAYLLKNWDLPYPIVEAALYYQHPDSKSIVNNTLVNAVHLASGYAWNPAQSEKIMPETVFALDKLGLSNESIQQLLIHYAKEKNGSI